MELKSTQSFMMIPFHYEGIKEEIHEWKNVLDEDFWSLSKIKAEDDILFPYIQNFLQNSINGSNSVLKPHDYRIFSLNTNKNPGLKVIYKNHMAINTEGRNIIFNFLDDINTLRSTKLIISPNASVGVLMIALELDLKKNSDIKDLMDLNYHIHKTHTQRIPIYLEDQLCIEDLKLESENETDADRKAKLKDLFGKKEEGLKTKMKNMECIYQLTKPSKKKSDNTGIKFWNLDDLLNLLFSSIKLKCVSFNPNRCHHFTYYHADTKDCDNELKTDFLRIVHSENKKYEVVDDVNESIIKTFENVYIGSSVEGSAVMTLNNENNEQFFSEFSRGNLQRYIWIYMMIAVQRYILLYMLERLTDIDDHNSGPSKVSLKHLRGFYRKLNEIKVNTYFTDISEFSHQNKFYQFCSRQLGIQRFFIEIDQKMQSLNDDLIQLSNFKKEKSQRILAYIVAILTIASASNDGLGWIKQVFHIDDIETISTIGTYLPVIFFVLIFIIWKKDLFD